MKVDSIHSANETAEKFVPLYTMQDRINIFSIARSNQLWSKRKSYKIKELDLKDFWDVQPLSTLIINNFKRDTYNCIINWLQIKVMRYNKETQILYNLKMINLNILDI